MSAEEFFGDFFEEIAKRDETISRAPKEAFVKRTPPVRNLNADKDDDEPRGARTSRAGEPPAADGKAADRFDVDQELAKTDASGAPTAGAGARRAVGGAPGELVAGLTPAEVTKLPAERRIALALDEKTKGNECFAAKEWHQAVLHYTHSLYLDQNSAAVYANRSLAYIKLSLWKGAESDASAALEIAGSYPKALLRRGIARRRLGKHEAALGDFRAVLAVEPGHREAKDYERATVIDIEREQREREKAREKAAEEQAARQQAQQQAAMAAALEAERKAAAKAAKAKAAPPLATGLGIDPTRKKVIIEEMSDDDDDDDDNGGGARRGDESPAHGDTDDSDAEQPRAARRAPRAAPSAAMPEAGLSAAEREAVARVRQLEAEVAAQRRREELRAEQNVSEGVKANRPSHERAQQEAEGASFFSSLAALSGGLSSAAAAAYGRTPATPAPAPASGNPQPPGAAQPPTAAGGAAGFTAASAYGGPRPGCVFKKGEHGLGYYEDSIVQAQQAAAQAQAAGEAGGAGMRRIAIIEESDEEEGEAGGDDSSFEMVSKPHSPDGQEAAVTVADTAETVETAAVAQGAGAGAASGHDRVAGGGAAAGPPAAGAGGAAGAGVAGGGGMRKLVIEESDDEEEQQQQETQAEAEDKEEAKAEAVAEAEAEAEEGSPLSAAQQACLSRAEEARLSSNALYSNGAYGQAAQGYTAALAELERAGLVCARGAEGAEGGKCAPAVAWLPLASDAAAAELRLCAIKCLNNRALCAVQQGRHAAVVADSSAVLQQEPTNVKALLRRGQAREALGMAAEAEADMRAAVALEADSAAALAALKRLGSGAPSPTAAGEAIAAGSAGAQPAALAAAPAAATPAAGGAASPEGGAQPAPAAGASAGAAPTPAVPSSGAHGEGVGAPAAAEGSRRGSTAAADQLKAEGNAAFKRGDWAQAASAYERAVAALSGSGDGDGGDGGGAGGGEHLLQANLSIALLKAGRPAPALQAARRAVALDPRFAKGHYRLGQAHQAMGQLSQAAAAYENGMRCCSADPKLSAEFAAGLRAVSQLGRATPAPGQPASAAELAAQADEEARAHAAAGAAARARARREREEAARLAEGSDEDEGVAARAAPRAPRPPPAAAAPAATEPARAMPAPPSPEPPPASASSAAALARAPAPPSAAPAKRSAISLEAAARTAERVAAGAGPVVGAAAATKPRTVAEFERVWKALWKAGGPRANADALRAYLELLPAAELAPFFGENMSDSAFDTLAIAARDLYLAHGKGPTALALLCGLARVRRVDVLWMFANKEAKAAAATVLAAGAQPDEPFGADDVSRARAAFA